MRIAASVLALVLLGVVPAAADVPTFITAQVFRQGELLTGPAFMEFTWRWEPALYCNLTPQPPPVGVVFNPATIQVLDPDPAHPNRVCRINWGLFLQTVPVGTGYRLTTQYLYADGPPSARSTVSGQFRRGPIGSLCFDRGGVAIETSQAVPNSVDVIKFTGCVEPQ